MKRLIKPLLIITIAVSLLLLAAVIVCSVYIYRYRGSAVQEQLLEINRNYSETEFYRFKSTERYGEISKAERIGDARLDKGIKYKYVSFDLIPENIVNAFVAIEDKRFYNHRGIDYLRTSKAAVNYLFGNGDYGGSTITQQLIKNLTEYDEYSVERKLTEAFSAINLEKSYDKTEILEMYLNVINLGEGCRGIGAAADYYYSKSPSELTLSECATIAAITNNPTIYDPQKKPENNKKRRDAVLKCMLEQGYISEYEYNEAAETEVSLNISDKYKESQVNSWYIDMVTEDVINDLSEKYGITKRSASLMLYRGGFRIYTAMDEGIQSVLEEYYSDEYNFPIGSNGEMPQSSMIIIDPYSGDILGVAGAVGKKTGNRIQNYATDVKRPPGSSIKPLSVYAPAIDRGLINWATVVEDSPIKGKVGESDAWPKNVDRTYSGEVNIQYAIAHSLNTVAVKVLQSLGERESFDFLKEKLLIGSLDAERDVGLASLALGQPSDGVTLRELTAAYSIFYEGIMSRSRSYYFVTDQSGRVILEKGSHQNSVISKETASVMTKLLETVVTDGTASGKITLNNVMDVAGKSGTSQNNCDRYFIGYTPALIGGVWFGYDYPKDLTEFGGNLSVCIWDDVMRKIYGQGVFEGPERFKTPDSIGKMSYNKKDGGFDISGEDASNCSEGWFDLTRNN